ncbi:MAG TPA: glycosyltransferase family 4 protein [Rhodanobacteraceae bacterium]|nr:glycosyltransferase family 4 protein [Rhodanobacteraceae bacterium]
METLISAACGWVVAVLLTAATLVYARRHGLLDLPGQRRSHSVPTPRGGGVGIVAAVVLVGVPAWSWIDPAVGWGRLAALGVAVVAVALIGWRDDHSPLPVLPRIAVQFGAALLAGVSVLAAPAGTAPGAWWVLVPLAIVLTAFINAHNFMDGIDGILGQQGAFVMIGYGLLAQAAGEFGLAAFAFVTALGCAGFLLFNAPPARIFMGDVGSGALGLLVGVVAAFLVQHDAAMLWPCLILSSAFLVDSGLTLARRVLGGQRWYAPHRQHLYQWLVRVKWSHARTDAAYLAWNIAIVAPLAWLAVRWRGHGLWFCIAAYAAAIVVWQAGKGACLMSARKRSIHGPA